VLLINLSKGEQRREIKNQQQQEKNERKKGLWHKFERCRYNCGKVMGLSLVLKRAVTIPDMYLL
tara:strand:+ start:236 stop:427 length:192 start_codon:yes stop_codon:yes gene_type:complete